MSQELILGGLKCRNKKQEENRTFYGKNGRENSNDKLYTINIYPLANGDTIGEPSSVIKNLGLVEISPLPQLYPE